MPTLNDYELLIDSLAEGEDRFSHSEEFTDASLREMKRVLDVLQGQLRIPAPVDEFEAELACEQALEFVEAIGRDPSFATRQLAAARLRSSGVEEPLPGGGLLGQYRLLMKLGEGGFGAVYKALHTRLDKVVALKVLTPSRLQNSQAVSRFNREMRAVGKLHHAHIVAAHDAGESEGMHYLVMELVDGIDLRELVKQRGRLPIGVACELIRQAALGLQHAHEHGLVHRDIKPSNLMLTLPHSRNPHSRDEAPSVKVLDLGLALLEEDHLENFGELTATGQVMGTLEYMAPEQGSDTHDVDIRADIYSLGASLYKLLTGKAPFSGDQYRSPVKLLMALATQNPPPLSERCPEITPDLEAIVQRMLSKQPTDRFATPRDVADALAPFSQPADLRTLVDFLATTPAREPVDVNSPAFIGTPATKSHPRTSSRETTPETMMSAAGHFRGRASDSRWASWIALAFAACGILIAAAMYVIEVRTPRGTLVIHSDYPDIKVKVKRDGKEVVDSWSLSKGQDNKQLINTGDIEIELPSDLTGEFLVTPHRLTLTKGKQEIVKVERKETSLYAKGHGNETEHPARIAVVKPIPLPLNGLIQTRGPMVADRERAAAKLWQQRGGWGALRMNVSGDWVELNPNSILPDQPFHLKSLHGTDLKEVTNADLEPLTNLSALSSLHLTGADIDSGAIPYLKQMPALVDLDLSGTLIRTSALAELRDLPHLQLLGVSGPMVDDNLRFLTQLKETYRFGTTNFLPTATDWQQLRQIRHLRNIAFTEEGLDLGEVAEFQRSNPACQVMVGTPPRTIGVDPMREAVRQLAQRNIGFNIQASQRVSAGGTMQEVLDNPARFYVATLEFHVPKEHAAINQEVLSPVRAIWYDDLIIRSAGISVDEFIAALPDDIRGQHINLANTNLTDRGLRSLAPIARPITLDISHTKVTEVGIKRFQQFRPSCTIHTNFGTFSGTQSINEPRQTLVPADRERAAVELWQQHLGSGHVFTEGPPGSANFDPFHDVQPGRVQFVLAHGQGVKGLTNEDLSAFTNLGGLKYLEPTGPQIDAGAIPYLKQIPTLIDLEVTGSQIPTSALAELGSHLHLMNLGVAGKRVDDQWKFLDHLPRLRSLRIHDLQPTAEDWQHLQAGRKLRQLHFFSEVELTPADVTLFQQNNPLCRVMVGYPNKRSLGNDPQREAVRQLTAKDMGMNIGIGEPLHAPVAQVLADPFPFYVDFIHIKLSKEPSFDAASLKPLQAILLNELRILWEGGNTDEFVANLPDDLAVQRLNLTGCDLTDKGLLRMHLMSPPSILDIRSTKVTREGVMAYQKTFPTCKVLSDR